MPPLAVAPPLLAAGGPVPARAPAPSGGPVPTGTPVLAQDSPTQTWIQDWTAFLTDTLPVIFLAVVILVGTVLIVRSRGGLQKAIIFGLGAALVFLILTNVDSFSDFFRRELPISNE